MGNFMQKNVKREKPEFALVKQYAGRSIDHQQFKLPQVIPKRSCYLKILKRQRIHDYLLLEKELLERIFTQNVVNEKINQEEKKVNDIRGNPLALARIQELFKDEKHAVVTVLGSKIEWYVPILSIVDRNVIKLNATVLVKTAGAYKNIPKAIIGVLDENKHSMAASYKIEKAPKETFADIGGCEAQIQEIKEAVELPLIHPEYYEEMGIIPPRGVILYGEPGTGKTLLAKAVANSTSATFIRVTASDFIKKTPGEGPKLIRDIFNVARECAPSIVFIDEVDAVGTKRYNTKCSGEQEIQRTLLELLNQLDGFEDRGNVKIIMATNRIESLDPALIRPGRIDRKIEFPLPNHESRKQIFEIHTSIMNKSSDVLYDEIFPRDKDISGAEIKAICTEAGILALRERKKIITRHFFEKAVSSVLTKKIDKKFDMFH